MIKLPETICTPQDLTELLVEIREYAKWYEHESVKQRSGTKTPRSTQPVLSVSTATYLRAASTNGSLQAAQLDTIIHELESYKAAAQTITITLAAPAPERIRTLLTAWCRESLSPTILVSFEYNRTLLGGMVVRYGSHVHDWSWRRSLLTTKTSFSEVLARV
jgi:hypothetical protein